MISAANAKKRPRLSDESATSNKKPADGIPVADESKQMSYKDQTSLRYISKQVSKKVEEKKTTNYNEVANELVADAAEYLDIVEVDMTAKERRNQEKNIRRRVYDALNVLLATDIITKTKDKDNKEKVIHWKGYPTSTRSDYLVLENEKQDIRNEVERKKQCLQELLVQNICFHNLDKRNAAKISDNTNESRSNSESNIVLKDKISTQDKESDKIPLPFIIVNTSEKAVIQCEMNREKTDVMFNFNMPFEINDDNEILKRLGLNKTTHEELKKILPSEILRYCEEQHLLDSVLTRPEETKSTNNVATSTQPSNQQQHQPSNQQQHQPSNQQQQHHHQHHQQHHQQRPQPYHIPSSTYPPPPPQAYAVPPNQAFVSSYHPPVYPGQALHPHPHPQQHFPGTMPMPHPNQQHSSQSIPPPSSHANGNSHPRRW